MKWEQAKIRHTATHDTPIPLYNGYVPNFKTPVLKIELEYKTPTGFVDNWIVSMFGTRIAEIKGGMNDAGKIKREAVLLLKEKITDIKRLIFIEEVDTT